MNVGSVDMEDEKLIENINVAVSAIEEVLGKPMFRFFRRCFCSKWVQVLRFPL
jgi:hypothetical protein